MSDISKFADDLEQLIVNHVAEAGITIASELVEHLVKVVVDRIYSGSKESKEKRILK